MEPNSGRTDAVIVKKTRHVFDVKFVVVTVVVVNNKRVSSFKNHYSKTSAMLEYAFASLKAMRTDQTVASVTIVKKGI
jgi:gluconate kinase